MSIPPAEPIDIPTNAALIVDHEPAAPPASMVPCEICESMIPFETYSQHLSSCITNRLFSISFVINDSNRHIVNGSEASDDEAQREEDRESLDEAVEAATSVSAAVNDYIETMGRSPSNILTGSSFREFTEHLFRGYRPQVPQNRLSNNNLNVVFVNLGQGELAERVGRVEIGVEDINAVSELLVENQEYDPDQICPICQDTFLSTGDVRRKLICNHIYCDTCITKWLENHKKCPVCNVELESASA